MKPRLRRAVVLALASAGLGAGLSSAYFLAGARAAGAPSTQPLVYAGTLTDTAGAPLSGMKNLQVLVWDKETDGKNACTPSSSAQVLEAGSFSVKLSADCLAAVHANPDLWVELLVDGASIGRTKIGAVPYALEADSASNAVGPLDTRLRALEGKKTGQVAGIWAAQSDSMTACASIVDSDWTDVPGTTVAVPDQGAKLTIWATYSINVQPGGASGTEYVGTRLVVDGTPVPASGSHVQPHSTADSNLNLNGNLVLPLAAGAHTVKLQWKTFGSTITWNNCPNWTDGFIGGRTVVVEGFFPPG